MLLVALNAKYIHTSLSVRTLSAYCGARYVEFTINDSMDRIYAALLSAKERVIGFSCYIWNIQYVLRIAQRLKLSRPDTPILLGGPEVSYDAPALLRRHAFIDFIITGEGEFPLSAFLRTRGGASLDSVPSLVWRDGDWIRQNPPCAPPSLDALPFAYTAEALPPKPRILYYESSRGCPYRCGFCLSAGTGVRFLSLDRALDELTSLAERGAYQVKFVDRTFNADIPRAHIIWRHLAGLRTGTNFHFEIDGALLDDESLDILTQAPDGRFQFEIGVQSANPDTLRAVGRPANIAPLLANTSRLIAAGNAHVHLDVIAGLPREDYASFTRSFNTVYALRPHMLQLGFLKFLKGTRLREDAACFGGIYDPDPPYEVLRTDCLSPDDLLNIKSVEIGVDTFYHSGRFSQTLRYLLRTAEAFTLYLLLGRAHGYRNLNPESALELLLDVSIELGFDRSAVTALLTYDWLRPEKRGQLPRILRSCHNDTDSPRIKTFYAQQAAAHLNSDKKTQAWRLCHVHKFDVDVLSLIERGEVIRRTQYVFFDYTGGQPLEITL